MAPSRCGGACPPDPDRGLRIGPTVDPRGARPGASAGCVAARGPSRPTFRLTRKRNGSEKMSTPLSARIMPLTDRHQSHRTAGTPQLHVWPRLIERSREVYVHIIQATARPNNHTLRGKIRLLWIRGARGALKAGHDRGGAVSWEGEYHTGSHRESRRVEQPRYMPQARICSRVSGRALPLDSRAGGDRVRGFGRSRQGCPPFPWTWTWIEGGFPCESSPRPASRC